MKGTIFIVLSVVVIFSIINPTKANDPAGSWLSYAVYKAPNQGKITMLNTTWTVPSDPKTSFGSNAPGWWFGVQTADGAGALIQPILAYGYQGNVFSIFNGVFDWNDGSWQTSDEVYTVQPGDNIVSSVIYRESDNSYDMIIASGGKSITTNYKILPQQGKKTESVAYFVLEHQPFLCSAYPTDGVCTFENIYVEVENKHVENPEWKSMQEQPKCNSKCEIVNNETIKFTWDAKSSDDNDKNNHPMVPFFAQKKWGYGVTNKRVEQKRKDVMSKGMAKLKHAKPLKSSECTHQGYPCGKGDCCSGLSCQRTSIGGWICSL